MASKFMFLKILFLKMANRFVEDDIGSLAAALSYYMIFSFFPILIIMSIILGRLGISAQQWQIMLGNILPEDVVDIALKYLSFVNSTGSVKVLLASLVFTIYFPVRAVKKLMDGINHAYNREGRNGFIKKYLSVLVFAMCVYVMVIFSIVILSVGERAAEVLLRALGLPIDFAQIWGYVRFIALWLIGNGMVLALHYISPEEKMRIRYMIPGCVLSVSIWTLVSAIFSYYVKYIGRYSILYGSIGAAMILLYWLYITAIILLMGAEFSSVLREIRSVRS